MIEGKIIYPKKQTISVIDFAWNYFRPRCANFPWSAHIHRTPTGGPECWRDT